MEALLSIGEFSTLTGLSPKRLRSYASAGILVPAAVDASSGYRYYRPSQIDRANLIAELRRAGASVAEIGTFLEDPSEAQLERFEQALAREMHDRRQALTNVRELLGGVSHSTEPRTTGTDGGGDMTSLTGVAKTDTGRVRPHNEDSVATTEVLAAVADGLGGHPAGEVASSTALEAIRGAYNERSLDELRNAVHAANAAVWEKARSDRDLNGMATTVCAVGLIDAARVGVVSVGDSRAYLFRNGTLTRVTEDHTVVGELVRSGELTETDAIVHPHRSVLTRALGIGPSVEADSAEIPVEAGDRLLLCTDGLYNELTEDQIAEVLRGENEPDGSVERLVALANEAGGRDNVSAVLVTVA